MTALDPISEPLRYQQALLAALGEDDPAVVDRVHLAQAHQTLRSLRPA